jgi:hypothetical protein
MLSNTSGFLLISLPLRALKNKTLQAIEINFKPRTEKIV